MSEIPVSVFLCACGGTRTISEFQFIGSRLEVNLRHVLHSHPVGGEATAKTKLMLLSASLKIRDGGQSNVAI